MTNSAGGRRKPKHESVEALLLAHPGETDPKVVIRRLAREKVGYAKSLGWTGPPFCHKIFTSIFGLRCREVHHDIEGEGQILKHPNGHVYIEYRAGRMPERQRFTVFHEFAHTLFPDYCAFQPYHYSPQQPPVNPAEKEFENLCDVGAAEILLPIPEFSRDLADLTWHGIESVHQLRVRYQASVDATIHRLVELTQAVPCAAVFLTDQKGDHVGSGPLWVKYCCRNPLFKGFFPAGTTSPKDSIAVRCLFENLQTTDPVSETWWIGRNPRTMLVQATRLPEVPENPGYSKVAALIFPPRYIHSWRRAA